MKLKVNFVIEQNKTPIRGFILSLMPGLMYFGLQNAALCDILKQAEDSVKGGGTERLRERSATFP